MMNEQTNQEVAVAYNASDLRSLYSACLRCRRNLIVIGLAPLLLGFFLFYDGFRGLDFIFRMIPYLLIGIVVVLTMYFLVPVIQLRSRRKNGWDRPIMFRLTEHEIASRHPSQNSQFPWSAIKNVVTMPERLYLFTTPACALILPRRCFADEAQFQTWSDQARQYWQAGRQEIDL